MSASKAPNLTDMDDGTFVQHLSELVSIPERKQEEYMRRAKKMREGYEYAIQKILGLGSQKPQSTGKHF